MKSGREGVGATGGTTKNLYGDSRSENMVSPRLNKRMTLVLIVRDFIGSGRG